MISILVPVYNEEEVIPIFVDSFFHNYRSKENFELIFINDGSVDKTKNIISSKMKRHKEIKLVGYNKNKGLGNALRVGFAAAKGRIIVTMDSDLAHPPAFIPKMTKKIDEGYDMVIGSRYIPSAGIRGVSLYKDFLSRITNHFTKIALFSSLKDLTSGFRAYKNSCLKGVKTNEVGFEVELEILARLMRKGAKIIEIPFKSTDRAAGISKFDIFRDGFRYITGLIKIMIYRWI